MSVAQTIFITGGSRGIGEAVVRLAAGRYNVAFTYNTSEDKAKSLQEELRAQGVLALQCDVRDEKSVSTALEAAKARFGKIDILINNAGISCDALLIDTDAKLWRDCFAVNVDGVFNMTKAVLPDMLSRKSGSIVNVASIWGEVGSAGEVAYSASKAAVIGFTKALAKEVALSGVRVNAVAPGAVDTDMLKCYTREDLAALCKEGIPLGRLGAPDEIAQAIMFAAQNAYTTGAVLCVDGLLGR